KRCPARLVICFSRLSQTLIFDNQLPDAGFRIADDAIQSTARLVLRRPTDGRIIRMIKLLTRRTHESQTNRALLSTDVYFEGGSILWHIEEIGREARILG